MMPGGEVANRGGGLVLLFVQAAHFQARPHRVAGFIHDLDVQRRGKKGWRRENGK